MRQEYRESASSAGYSGVNPRPEDFDAFWDSRLEQVQEAALDFSIEPCGQLPPCGSCQFLELRFRGVRGEEIYAKYLRPTADGPVPLVLQFHGYPGASRSWLEQASFPGLGCALLAMDCPGQGGRGWDPGGYVGTGAAGHLVAGLDGEAKDMYYVRLYQNIALLCRIVRRLKGIDLDRIYINGASQGGGLGIVCAALDPLLPKKAAILYPFLCDFQKVWELDRDESAYQGLRYYSRWFDPDGTRKQEMFWKLGYIDVLHFAPRVRCEVLFGTGLSDTVCPPATQLAVYNRLTCKKRRMIFPEYGHEEIQAFDDQIIPFFYERGEPE